MKIRVHRKAPVGHTWKPESFTAAVDKPIPLTYQGMHLGMAYLRGVAYSHNYRTAVLTIEVSDDG